MTDDIEHLAFGWRPRDARPGPHRVPDARTLGRRLAALRQRHGLSVADVADAAGLWHHVVEEFEEYGAVAGETMLWLIEVVCPDDHLAGAFERLGFADRDAFLRRWGVAGNVVEFRGRH